jgi:prepilin-type N-terminal cleavage/methylation domain-containing protein
MTPLPLLWKWHFFCSRVSAGGAMKLLRDKRGVTLLELMVVLGIVAAMAVVAVPSYYSMLPHLRVRGAARDVAEALQVARMKAVSKNTTYVVQFNYYDGSPANYFSMGPEIGTSGAFTKDLDSSTYGWKGVQVWSDWASAPESFTAGKVFFYSDGTASVDGNPVLGNQGAVYLAPVSHSECYRVLVDELTGKATVQHLNGVQWVDQ